MEKRRSSLATYVQRTKRSPAAKGVTLLLVLFAAFLFVISVLAPAQPTASNVTQVDADGAVIPPALHITEVMSSNHAAYPDENGKFSDWVELTNEGDTPITLEGFGLSDREDKIIFTFPAGHVLQAGERVVVFADDSSKVIPGISYHAKFKISSAGETLILFGPAGNAIEHITVPSMISDTVYAKTLGGWIISDMFTPGYPNTQEGHAAFRASSYLDTGALVLNEMVASNHTTLADEDGDYSDWIELYNNSDREINLSNYALSDNVDKRVKWRFPQDAFIAPHGYYLVFASGKNRPGGEGLHPHTNFGLSAEKETVMLSDIHGQLVDETSYEVLPADQSWGRRDTGDLGWQVFTQPTPGLPNNRDGALEMNRRMLMANVHRIAITEAMTSNVSTTLPNGVVGLDWVELYNYGSQPTDLTSFGLSDRVNHPRKWQFPFGTTILPGEHLLVYCDSANTGKAGELHTNFNLSSSGETVVLSDPTGKILDKLVVPQLPPDYTYGKTPGLDGLFYYAEPTPGTLNGPGFIGFAETPVFLTSGGIFPRPMTVEIQVPTGAEIRYTLDCTEPTLTSPLYEGPIEIPKTTVVRARAFQGGLNPSTVATQTYFISVYHTMPIISLVTEPENITNPDTGMLADGPNLDREAQNPPWNNATYWKKLHYEGHFEMFDESSGKQLLSTGMEFHVMGQYSLDMPQKSFSINAKKRFGTGYFEYPFFENRPFEHYKSIALRNGGQDGLFTRVIDGLQGRIVAEAEGSTVLAQAWRPVIVFLNGQYWGHYNMRERVSRHFVAQHEGWENPDAMDILESDGTGSRQVNWGSNKEYKALLSYVEGHDLREPEALQYVADRVDIDNMFDYYIFEMFFGNSDPGNIRFYKKHGEGNKWRWIFYDSDWGLFDSTKYGPSFFLKASGAGGKNINNLLIRKVLENPEMRDQFLRRMGELFQTVLTTENMQRLFDEMTAQIQTELPMHYERWATSMNPKISFDVPKNPTGAYNYWLSRVNRTRNTVMVKRPHLFWGMAQEFFELTDAQMIDYFGPRPSLPEEAVP